MTNPKSLADLIREADEAIDGAIAFGQHGNVEYPICDTDKDNIREAIRAIVRACAEIGKTHDRVHPKGGLFCGAGIESVILAALKEADGE